MKKAEKITAALRGLLIPGLSWPTWNFYAQIQKARSEYPLVREDVLGDF